MTIAPTDAVAQPVPAYRPNALLRWVLGRFFRHIDVDRHWVEGVRDAAKRGTVVYVMRSLSILDFLCLDYLTKAHSLPLIRFVNDVLLSAPSILIGLFVYELMVAPMHGFSGYAGAVALAFIAVPVVTRTTEDVLRLQPTALRESGIALGAPVWTTIRKILWKAAAGGIVTGGLLAFARISGETAPLLFTALNNQFWTSDVTQPMASLPVTIFKFAMSPYENWQHLAWAGVFLITVAVLALNILARVLTRSKI